jgi:hypothetical protein
VVVGVKRGEDQDLDLGVRLRDPRGRLHAVEVRHLEVHEHDVGGHGVDHLDGLLTVSRLADHLDALVGLEELGESRSEEGLIVGDQHPRANIGGDAHSSLSTGKMA